MSNCTCNILIAGDLNARILNHIDFIVNESIKKCNSHETLEYLLPDNDNTDYNINRCSVDKILNAQGQQLIDLCIASQVRVLNGRFVGDSVGNVTCYKSNGASTVDYALADVDLLKNINFFQVSNPSYLSDHVQIVVHLYCNISLNEKYDNALHSNTNLLKYSYKWGEMSKHKLLDAMSENSILEQIVSFENSSFEKNSTGIDEASDDLNNIFQNLAKRSCRFVHLKKKKVKKKPWIDTEFKDLKKTVLDLGSEVKKTTF
jgi:hypothetical protein